MRLRTCRPCAARPRRVADPLALVGLGFAHAPDLCGNAAHQFLVDPGDGEVYQFLDFHGDPLRNLVDAGHRVAHEQLERRARQLRAEAHAGDLEALGEAGAHPRDHVGDEGPHEAVHGPGPPALVGGPYAEGLALLDDLDIPGQRPREIPLGSRDLDLAAGDADRHLVRQGDDFFPDS